MPGATFLLNSPYGPDEVWDHLPAEVQKQIIDKKLKFYVVDAYHVARDAKMGVRINTIMQTCFFKLANVIPADEAIAQIKDAIKKTYGKKGGGKIVEQNNAAVDGALAALARGEVPEPGHLEAAHGAAGSGQRPGVRQGRAGHDDRQPRRRPAGQRAARSTARSPPARRSTRSGASPRTFPSGIRRSASSAACARWAARTPRSA